MLSWVFGKDIDKDVARYNTKRLAWPKVDNSVIADQLIDEILFRMTLQLHRIGLLQFVTL